MRSPASPPRHLRPALSLRLLTSPAGVSEAKVTPAGALVSLVGDELTIGSDPRADLTLTGPGVAPQHCRIRVRGEAHVLLDLGRGTRVNGRPMTEPRTLVEGDQVTVGPHVLEVIAPRFVADLSALAATLRREARLLPEGPVRAPAAAEARADTRTRGAVAALSMALALLGGEPGGPGGEAPTRATEPVTEPRPEAPEGPREGTPSQVHRVLPGETLPELASRYGVPLAQLARWNGLAADAPLAPGLPLIVRGSGRAERELVRRRVREGDSWDSLARELGSSAAELRAHNPRLTGELRPGDELDLWLAPVHAAPRRAALVVPSDARSWGSPHGGGGLEAGLRLPPDPRYDLRCPGHAYASSATATALLSGLGRLRERYRGQIVVGDLSRAEGGRYGPHRSHQSGRDVDLWLPIVGGLYRSSPACRRCGTSWCRPLPHEIDWRATWALIDALVQTGAVQQVFLDRALLPRLREAARAAGLDAAALRRAVQHKPGAPALVTHSAGHVHHLHVRFRCGADEPACVP